MYFQSKYKIAVLIPAMGNCHQIPRKFVRSLDGRPLITYSLDLAKSLTNYRDIIVINDDEEIDLVARRKRVRSFQIHVNEAFPLNFSDKLIIEQLNYLERDNGYKYDFVIWMGPSSPLIRERDIIEAVEDLNANNSDAVFSASHEAQHGWFYTFTYQPSFGEISNSLNNGFMHRETGAFFIMKRSAIDQTGYIGKSSHPYLLHETHSIEINTFNDWWVAEKYLKKKQILFVVAGFPEIGLGHVYRTLALAQEFSDHEIGFLCTKGSEMAYENIKNYLYPCKIQNHKSLLDNVLDLSPDLVINDILSTDASYIKGLKRKNISVINFEDDGNGSGYADLVVNALYDKSTKENMLVGYKYFCLRDEFFQAKKSRYKEKVKRVLITFGGTDSNNLTLLVLKLLVEKVNRMDFKILIVTGPGYSFSENLEKYIACLSKQHQNRVQWFKNGTRKISELMGSVDFAITSAGRTVYELTHLNVPSIIMSANERELFHTFGKKAGHVFLGIWSKLTNEEILNSIFGLLNNNHLRKRIHNKLAKYDFAFGKMNLVERINGLIYLKRN